MPNETGRILRVIRDGDRAEVFPNVRLRPGVQGNIVTLSVMSRIVRSDAAKPDLRNFVYRSADIGLDNSSYEARIASAFRFASAGIEYRDEAPGYETVADLWSCMYSPMIAPERPSGDCAIKCVALGTILSVCGVRPEWVAVGQMPNADDFNHVYVGFFDNSGEYRTLDPTPSQFRPGDEAPALRKMRFPVYGK